MQKQKIKLINGENYEILLDSKEIQDHFGNRNNYTREILSQFNDQDYYKEYITEKDKIILDFGSNVGLFALHVSPFAKKVYCFEPTPSHFKLNEGITGSLKNVVRFQKAVADKTGETTFYTSSQNSTMNSLINRNESSFQVETISIKDVFETLKIKKADFVKIDIEGSEVIALTDEAIQELASKTSKVLIEFHTVDGVPEYKYRDEFKQRFENAGMNTKSFNNDGLYCWK